MMITNYQMVQIVWFTVLIHIVRQIHTFRVERYDCSSAQYFRYFQSNQDFEERICHYTVPRMHIT